MDKYQLLILLNLPFVIFGITRSVVLYKEGSLERLSFLLRIIFWLLVTSGLIFAQQMYDFLVQKKLTDSTPLSIADVVLVTGVSFCLFMIIRLYSKMDGLEKKLTDMQEKLSIKLSIKK